MKRIYSIQKFHTQINIWFLAGKTEKYGGSIVDLHKKSSIDNNKRPKGFSNHFHPDITPAVSLEFLNICSLISFSFSDLKLWEQVKIGLNFEVS